eukprot:gene31386-38853_t
MVLSHVPRKSAAAAQRLLPSGTEVGEGVAEDRYHARAQLACTQSSVVINRLTE